MNAKTLLSLIALGSILFGSFAFAQNVRIDKPMVIRQRMDPIFPRTLLANVTKGEARLVINVDAEGKLKDYLVVGYTKKEFADATVMALKTWTFEPAISNGQPTPVVSDINVEFEATGVVVSMTATEAVASMYYWWERNASFEYHPVAMQNIDRIPLPQNVVAPVYPKELANLGVSGDVTILFYINEEGQVKMPAVTEAPDMRLADLAMSALTQWKFEPPTRKGRPVLVRALQTFRFTPGEATKAPASK